MISATTYMNVLLRPDESVKKLTWKRIERKRSVYEYKFALLFRNVLNKQYRSLDINSTNYRDENIIKNIETGPIEWAMMEMYKTVGSSFAQEAYNGLKAEAGERLVKEEEADVWYQRMINHIKTVAGAKIVSITEETRRQALLIIRKVLGEAVNEGLGADATATLIKRRLVSDGVNINQWRALRIARTEIVSASNLGSMEGALATSLPMEKYWLPTYDNRTRDTHLAVAKQNPKAMNEKFEVGLYMMSYPGSEEGGAEEVINCRCAITHAVKTIQNIKP